jgi:uncharacterized surface protein with fasciclin (FAS1) repeats
MNRILLSSALFAFTLAAVSYAGAGTSFSRTPQSPPPPTKNVYEIIKDRKDLSKFADLIGDADLKELFTTSPDEPITVFVPTNDAMENISHTAMKRIEGDKASLQSFVKYHVISGNLVASGAIRGRRASPAASNGEALQFDGLTDKDKPKVNDATLVEADIPATNGMIQVVSTGLVPPSLQNEPVPPPAPPTPPGAPSRPSVPAPVASSSATPAAATTSAATSATVPAAVKPDFTTSGVAKAVPVVPAPMPATTSAQPAMPPAQGQTGFTLFGHQFSW